MTDAYGDDVKAINTVIDGLFEAISWTPDRPADWQALAQSFHDDAVMIPSARPIATVDVRTFSDRMQAQRDSGALTSFEERVLHNTVHVMGNAASVANVYEGVANGGAPFRGVNMLLLSKEDGRWKVVAMTWAQETDDAPLPAALLGRNS